MSVLFLFSLLLGQKPTARFKEAIDWLVAYTNAHGRRFETGAVTQTTHMNSVQGCSVRLEKEYFEAKSGNTVKHESVILELGDFGPRVHVQLTHTEGNNFYQVTFERTDAANRVEVDFEMGDGTTLKGMLPNEWIYTDSEESVNRLAKDLSHAIELCGGKPAPF